MIFLLFTERKTSKQANKYDLLISKEGFRSKLWVDMSVTFFMYFGKLLLLFLSICSSSVWLFFFIVTISQLKLYATKFKFCALKKLPVNICVYLLLKGDQFTVNYVWKELGCLFFFADPYLIKAKRNGAKVIWRNEKISLLVDRFEWNIQDK